jgi:hypothetical protein
LVGQPLQQLQQQQQQGEHQAVPVPRGIVGAAHGPVDDDDRGRCGKRDEEEANRRVGVGVGVGCNENEEEATGRIEAVGDDNNDTSRSIGSGAAARRRL